ncbi:prolyl aminopeptidase [Amycolatopsis sp. AA4]|uniref:prolyl aminopeptidase n=1 Tax=Actinomycetes TaxID=1760 RepID=UPI0001B555BE|nr:MULTISPECIES: prolyl aminopeptidase [Actinomycetes]ATY12135.1 prolyl aminopeptidase [Amycolatopsis sp. AA4]EFL07851.1 proline iminopeptidase [Streptomyces sp. AA4]
MRYPEIEPYDSGLLDVGEGHRVYWETCGNPDGKPVAVLHGGPGTGCSEGMRQFFDPERYRIVLLDQRGSGRSTPHAGDTVDALNANTAAHLISDFELLREKLGIERWQLFGGSWGCVLGLAYAEQHPERVTEIVMMGLATDRQSEIDLLTGGLGEMFPEAYARFREGVPESERDGDLAAAYYRLLTDPDPAVHEAAAKRWCDWESAMQPGVPPSPKFDDPRFRLCFARLVTHYFSQGCFREDGAILRDAAKLAGIPTVLVQGILDLSSLTGTPWLLERAIPHAELILVSGAGHTTAVPSMETALIAATDKFAATE